MEQSPATPHSQSASESAAASTKAALLTTSEAASVFGVTSQTIRNWDDKGFLQGTRTPKGYRFFDRAEVESKAKVLRENPFLRPANVNQQLADLEDQ